MPAAADSVKAAELPCCHSRRSLAGDRLAAQQRASAGSLAQSRSAPRFIVRRVARPRSIMERTAPVRPLRSARRPPRFSHFPLLQKKPACIVPLRLLA